MSPQRRRCEDIRGPDDPQRGENPRRDAAGVMAAVLSGLLLALVAGCLSGRPDPYVPPRPQVAPGGRAFTPAPAPEPFPERTLLEERNESPPETLARIEAMFWDMALAVDPDPVRRRAVVEAEIDSIRSALDRLDLGAGLLLRQRMGRLDEEERERLRRAAALYLRWGMALMRIGSVDERTWGADKLRRAVAWDPGNPIPVLVLGAYLEQAGFASNQRDLLDEFVRDHGHHDLIDLQRIRKQERLWKITRFADELGKARALAEGVARRKGGWESAPGWMHLEQARLLYLADSVAASRVHARTALHRSLHERPGDAGHLTGTQAALLLGVLDVRDLEYGAAEAHFDQAFELAAATPGLARLASWMSVPWDLWAPADRLEYDSSTEPQDLLDRFWRESDPILATPDLLENRVEYLARIGEAWFSLGQIDPRNPGPLTDPGKVILRYGRPREWTSTGGEAIAGFPLVDRGYSVNRSWRFEYLFPPNPGVSGRNRRLAWAAPGGTGTSALPASWSRASRDGALELLTRAPLVRPVTILFQDGGSAARFAAVDSLRGPNWPPFLFDFGFAGRGYRLNTAIARFRQPDGAIRLVLSYDTYLPEYSVRYPLQGLRYEGSVSVRTVLYEAERRTWQAGPRVDVNLDRETTQFDQWTFRRRSAQTVINGLEPCNLRIASLLTLRDEKGRITALAVDNGEPGKLLDFGWNSLEASDLLLLSSFGNELPEDRDRLLKPGLVSYGTDLIEAGIPTRAGRHFLPGDDIGFYLEVYNIDTRDRVTDAELLTSLEKLQDDGSLDYTVMLRGQSQTLIRFGVSQWNVARSLGLSSLDPGHYRLRVAVFDRKGSQRVERIAEFQVVSPEELVDLYGWRALEAPRGS